MRTVYYCPVEVTMELIGGKWTAVILAHLKEAPRRFSELRRLIPDVSEKMLTQRLRALQSEGIASRPLLGDTPPHVEYDLTDAGRSLAPALQALYDWGRHWANTHDIAIESDSTRSDR
jgi:DNA-binding HxlR family transcriptional regulator